MPYEIIFGGRVRSCGGIPRQPQPDDPDAKDWIEQGRHIDRLVADKVRHIHQQRFAAINESCKAKPVYQIGDHVWLLRPRNLGVDKLQSWWLGPCRVTGRRGADSYIIQDKPGHNCRFHSTQLRPNVEDTHADDAVPLD